MAWLRDVFKNVEDWTRRVLSPPREVTLPQRADADGYSDAAQSFVNTQAWHPCASTHHRAAWYDRGRWEMHFEFHDGKVYTVEDLSPTDAVAYHNAPSKGIWYWDNIRVRGKGNFYKTRKPYRRGM